jgi:predicted NUDIX family NTP pyrophosphohydrolase
MKRLYKGDFGLNVQDHDIKEFADLAQKAGKKLAKFAKSRDLDLRDADSYAQSQINLGFVMEMLHLACKQGETK